MKIHYLVKTFEGGGTGFAMIPVLQLLRDAGFEIDITACYPGNMISAKRFEEAGFTCQTLSQNHTLKITLIWQFIKLMRKKGRPDIIMTSLPLAVFVGQISGKLLGIPVVSWQHLARLKPITIRLKHPSKFWIADSYDVGNLLQKSMNIKPEKVFVWPLFFCEVKKSERPVWTGNTPLKIGSIGRLNKIKNYPDLLEEIALFRKKYLELSTKISVSILGEGPDRKNIENKIRELALEDCISLLGYSPDIYNYLATLDLYVQPSHYEGMCMAAHEALSTGLPLMATVTGEMKTSLKHGTGFILDNNIPEDICNNLKIIFNNPSLLEIKRKNSLDYMNRYYIKYSFEENGYKIVKNLNYLCQSKK